MDFPLVFGAVLQNIEYSTIPGLSIGRDFLYKYALNAAAGSLKYCTEVLRKGEQERFISLI